ncbi:MAG: DNA polymerase III subunit beta [Pirellulaceae bacterium]|nr:DNA polymerase III subunit beta [Planctomycetales bacterium]
MKITANREALLAAFQTAAPVAPSRSPKEILRNVKMTVTNEETVLSATDTEVGVRLSVPQIDVAAPGSVLLPVDKFGLILRESSVEQLAIESDGNSIEVRGQHSRFKLPAQNPDEFPEVVSFYEQSYHEVPARLIRELVRRTLFATDTQSSRYALGGVLLEFEPERIIGVGTDGRRLAKMEGPAVAHNDHKGGDGMTIVPSRAMQLIDRTVTEADAEIAICARNNDILVRTPRATIYARLVEGRFPRWRDVFPSRDNSLKINLTVGPFYAAVRQAAILTSDESRGLDLSFTTGNLTLSASAAEVGQSHVELPIPYEGEQIDVTLDNRYVADFLKVLDLEKMIVVDVLDNESAVTFATDDGYDYVVMPLSREGRR